jgi:hypothetical protein
MSTDRGVLEPGRKIERQLPARETDSYRLTLEVGQFASVAVEQRGVDVVVRLFAPSGDELTEVDSPTGTTGFERFSEVGRHGLRRRHPFGHLRDRHRAPPAGDG